MPYTKHALISLALAALTVAPALHATPVDVPIGSLLPRGEPYRQLPRVVALDVGDVRVTVRASTMLRVYDLMAYGGDSHEDGAGLIDWPWPSGSNQDGTVIQFTPAVSSVSVRAGDFSGDGDGPLTLTAYDCNDTPIATTSRSWDAGRSAPFAWLEVHGAGICRVSYHSGGTYAGSTFIAGIRFEPGR